VSRNHLTRFAWLSIAAALATIAIKAGAWWLTGSVGLLSDALESIVNLVAAAMTLWMLSLSARPPTEEHAYGYSKAEYFSSGLEGALIFAAALAIAWTAIDRLLHPQPLERVGLGLGLSLGATAINFVVARVLMKAALRYQSIALEADAHHLMTDVITSIGVIVGVAVRVAVGSGVDVRVAVGTAVVVAVGTAVAVAFVPLGYAVAGFLVGLGLLIFAVRRPGAAEPAEVRALHTGTDR